jgi:hypothetical protein
LALSDYIKRHVLYVVHSFIVIIQLLFILFAVLIVGAGDGRHLLETFSGSESNLNPEIRKTGDPEIRKSGDPEMFVLEQNLMTYARQILFLALLQDDEIGSSRDAAQMILELFGNISVRTKTSDFVRKKSAEFVNVVTSLSAKVFHLKTLKR